MSNGQAGKGDKRRPGNDDKYRNEHDRVFGKKENTRHCFDCDEIIPWDNLFCKKCKNKKGNEN